MSSPDSDDTSVDVLYELAHKIQSDLRSSADRQERKAQITIAAISLFTSATIVAAPSATDPIFSWYGAMHLLVVVLAVAAVTFCMISLMLKPYPYNDNLDKICANHWDDTADALKRQLISDYAVHIDQHYETFEWKAGKLRVAVNYLVPILAALIVLSTVLRVQAFSLVDSTKAGECMNTNQSDEQTNTPNGSTDSAGAAAQPASGVSTTNPSDAGSTQSPRVNPERPPANPDHGRLRTESRDPTHITIKTPIAPKRKDE